MHTKRIALLGGPCAALVILLCASAAFAAEPAEAVPTAAAVPAATPPATTEAAANPIAAVLPETPGSTPGAEQSAPASAVEPVAESTSDGSAAEPLAGYEKGFFVQSADGEFSMKIGARVQTLFTYEAPEGAPVETQFSFPRARLSLAGHAFTEALTYKFQSDFGKGQASLKDFYADYEVVPGWLFVQTGQAKRPFSRQQITSSGNLQFVDRAITDKAFGAGRDIGVTLHNNFMKSPEFEYALGLYNGTGDGTKFSGAATVDPATGEGSVSGGNFSNVPKHLGPALVARIGYNHGEYSSYSESDMKGGDLRFAIAASGLADFEKDGEGKETLLGEVDFDLKVSGFSATGAVYVCSSAEKTKCFDGGADALGLHVQAGYAIANRFEPVVRFAAVGNDGDLSQETEMAAGLSIYMYGHNVKLQTDVASLSHDDGTTKTSDVVSRTQFQFSF